MLPADPHPLAIRWFRWYCAHALRKHFHRVHLFGDVPFDPARSTLYVVNHNAFWDALVLNHLIATRRPQPAFCMADAVQVRRHPFFRRVGAFSVDRANPRDGMRAVRHAAALLNASPCAVGLFPQGKIVPADAGPVRFERGIERILAAAAGAEVVVVALRYQFWMDQRPELLVDLSRADERTTAALERQLDARLDALAAAGREHRAGEEILVEGRRSISEWTARRA